LRASACRKRDAPQITSILSHFPSIHRQKISKRRKSNKIRRERGERGFQQFSLPEMFTNIRRYFRMVRPIQNWIRRQFPIGRRQFGRVRRLLREVLRLLECIRRFQNKIASLMKRETMLESWEASLFE
jgi:hypothetical protein